MLCAALDRRIGHQTLSMLLRVILLRQRHPLRSCACAIGRLASIRGCSCGCVVLLCAVSSTPVIFDRCKHVVSSRGASQAAGLLDVPAPLYVCGWVVPDLSGGKRGPADMLLSQERTLSVVACGPLAVRESTRGRAGKRARLLPSGSRRVRWGLPPILP